MADQITGPEANALGRGSGEGGDDRDHVRTRIIGVDGIGVGLGEVGTNPPIDSTCSLFIFFSISGFDVEGVRVIKGGNEGCGKVGEDFVFVDLFDVDRINVAVEPL